MKFTDKDSFLKNYISKGSLGCIPLKEPLNIQLLKTKAIGYFRLDMFSTVAIFVASLRFSPPPIELSWK